MGLGAFACGVAGTKKGFGAFEMGFGAFACGVQSTKKAFGGFAGFWWVLERLTAGKRQASTPRKSYWDGPWCLC